MRLVRASRSAALSVCALLVLAGCADSQSSSPSVGPPSTVARVSPSHPGDLFRALLDSSRDLGPSPSNLHVSVLLLLRNPHAAQQQAALAAIYDPRSPSFGHFQSAQQWARSNGPVPSLVAAAQRGLRAHGLTGIWQRGNSSIQVEGPAGTMERVFGVRIHDYAAPQAGGRFWASMKDLVIPSWLRPSVAGAGHLSSYSYRALKPARSQAKAVPVNGLSPTDMLKAYDIKPLRDMGLDGSGETVAFIEIDGYNQSDFDAFTKKFNLPAMHPQLKYGSALAAGGEAELDMEVVHEIVPKATLTVYNCSANCSSSDIVAVENAAAKGTPHGVISVSLGGCEPAEGSTDANAEKGAFDQADALGESVFVSSGDNGAYECLSQNYNAAPSPQYVGLACPACTPSVTAVGGTRLSLNADSTYYREEAWELSPETAGGGGGVSTLFSRPSWQTGHGVNNSYDTGNHRLVPDVSADADPLTSAEINVKGQFTQEGGTSQAAPIWAAITALTDQYLQTKGLRAAGFLNPALYSLANTSQPYPPFHDITVGTNLVYPAGPGYDLATGLGTPDSWNLARDLEAYIKGGGR